MKSMKWLEEKVANSGMMDTPPEFNRLVLKLKGITTCKLFMFRLKCNCPLPVSLRLLKR